ncbi:MAG: VaFE repeat-containing surface-anchored protein, partial [Clostridiales bacterium]|nr:VaFE repeat-containing surface-anchored protein [Clostridiales bacterium]
IYSTWYSATKALINEYHNAAVSFDGTKLTLEAGESTTLTDSNGYLQYYPNFNESVKNVTYKHTKGSNSMTVSVSESATAGKTSTFNSADSAGVYIAIPKDTGWSDTVTYNSEYNFDMYYGFYSYQNLFYSKFANPESTQDFTVQVTIEETPPLTGDLTIVKTADDSAAFGGDMSIFKFKITSTDGYSKSVKLGADGTYTLTGLDVYDDEGNLIVYTIKEKDKPTRYVTPATQSVTLKEDTTVKVSFNNTPKTGDLYVYKSSDDGVIKNIKFTITWTYAGKEYTQSETTNSEGIAKFTDLDVYDIDDTKIVYTISEANVPTRYYTPDEIEVKLITDDVQEVDITNEIKRGNLYVYKNSEDSIISGLDITITFEYDGKEYTRSETTNSDGEAKFEDLRVYDTDNTKITYTVSETNVPLRYYTPDNITVKLTADETKEVTLTNDLKKGDLKIVKTSEDGVVKGFTFKVVGTDSNGDTVYSNTVTTGSDGTATLTDLYVYDSANKKIKYTVTETNVPVRYVTPDSVTHTLTADDTTEFSVYNEHKKGNLKIIKVEETGTVYDSTFENGSGWTFTVSYTWNGKEYSKTVTTWSHGTYTLEDLPVYDTDNSKVVYTISEGSKSDGSTINYVTPDNQSGTLSWESAEYNLTAEFTFTNYLKRWSATVTKTDSETAERAQGDATLAGAVYGVYKGGELVDTYTTDSAGQFTTKYYICGADWTIAEITPSEGYLLDETEYAVGASAGNFTLRYNSVSNSVTEDVIKGKISIIKHADDGSTQIETPEEGATFEIYLKSAGSYDEAAETERDILVCDEDGYAVSKELPYGVYTVHQTYGWDGTEYITDFDVYISTDGKVYKYLINNAPFESYVQIIKTDAETGVTIPYAGAGFQIYDSAGELVTMQYTYPSVTVIDTFYTNADGYLITPEKLDYGEYTLVEVQAPYGYVLDSTPVSFSVERGASYYDDEYNITIIDITAKDMPQKGVIEITKTGEVFSSVSSENENGTYTPVYEDDTLAGAIFEIYAAEDISTPDGTLRYSAGELVDTLTTGSDGTAASKELYLGKYTVIEVTAPDTFYNPGNSYDIELTYQGQEVSVYTTDLGVYNDRQTVTVSLVKEMESDSTYGITGEFSSVLFGLYAAEDIEAADGSVIPADSLITSARCDENGSITFDCDLPIGFNFYVQEIETDERYILNDAKFYFDTEYQGQEVANIAIAINDGSAITNELIRGSVQLTKTDRETGLPIAGVVFGLFNSTETQYTEANAILTVTTGSDGTALIENVPWGQYTIKELQAADGYLNSADYHHLSIQLDGQTVVFAVVNDQIPTLQTTATINGNKDVTAQETITIVDTVSYEHLVPGRVYTLKGVLMNKATGKKLVVNGETVESTITFTPESPSGTVNMEFTFDASAIDETTDAVVYETLYYNNTELATHSDLTDEGQTVTLLVPTLATTATIGGEKEATAQGEITITDTVTYTNLEPGVEYTLTGTLMDKSTGKAFTVNGEEVTSTITFTPTTRNGSVEMTFTFDSSAITADTELVVYETLYYNNTELATHSDLTDEGQTVTLLVPTLATTATIGGEKEATAQGEITITDTVTYTNLEPGVEYTLTGTLMDKSTGKAFTVNGEEVTSTITFTPTTRNGSVEMTFTFDSSAITADTELVVYETLYYNNTELATHSDLTDEGQTVTLLVPTLATTATIGGEKEATAQGEITITDTVTYTNLEPGVEYTLTGTLMDKSTGKAFKVDGQKITSTITFTPTTRNGSVDMTFTFDSSAITADTDLVVYETLYYNNTELATHSDLTDEGQTVTLLVPTLATTATIGGEKE